jgi:hypothetical protein
VSNFYLFFCYNKLGTYKCICFKYFPIINVDLALIMLGRLCRMHKDALRRLCTRGRIADALLEAQHHEQFWEWYCAYVRK